MRFGWAEIALPIVALASCVGLFVLVFFIGYKMGKAAGKLEVLTGGGTQQAGGGTQSKAE